MEENKNLQYIQELCKFTSPIVYDAIEKFNLRSRTAGYTDSTIKAITPELGAVCGYARTGKITGSLPQCEGDNTLPIEKVWKYAGSLPKPGIMVVEDTDPGAKLACAWGDYSASVFGAMGCVGCVTNGCVRDVDEVRALGFHMFASSKIVGHAYNRYISINTPVTIGGLIINPGDLIHADQHGVGIIPAEIPLDELIAKAKECVAADDRVVSYCKSPNFSVEGLLRGDQNL